MRSNKTLIFFANPFGFGPTGKCAALITEIKTKWNGEVIFAGSRYSYDLINQKDVIFEEINDRDIAQIKSVIKKYPNPHVISCLNRFAIKSSVNLNIPCVVIDSLSWFWKQFPDGLLDADLYFAQKLPGIDINVPEENKQKFVFVSAIVGTETIPVSRNFKTIIHIGGGENPFISGVQENYLTLLGEILNSSIKGDLMILGGKKSINFLKTKIKKSSIKLLSLEREKFLKILAGSSQFITTPGLTASLEAMSFNVPVSFLLPSNLSQWANQRVFVDAGVKAESLLWGDYINFNEDINGMTEKEGIPFIEKLSKKLNNNKVALNKIKDRFNEMIQRKQLPIGQTKFIKLMGNKGVNEIIERLQKEWNFN